MEKNYYVYVYLDVQKPGDYIYDNLQFKHQPFYVGKGKGNRLYSHLSLQGKNYLKKKIIKSSLNANKLPVIQKIYTGLTNEEAIFLEIELIKKIGRLQNNNGPLTNMTDGGEGHAGLIQSEETKQKRKESRDKSTFWTTVKSDDFKKRMSKIASIRYQDEEERKKISETKLGNKNHMFGKTTSSKQKEVVKQLHKDGKIKLSKEGREKLVENGKNRKGKKNINIRCDVIIYKLTSPLNEVYYIRGAKKLQYFCSQNKLQYHKLKSNVGIKITNDIINSKTVTAINTLNWKIEYEKTTT